MKLALLHQAGTIYDFLSDDIDDGKFWVKENYTWLRYVAYDVKKKFN
jgi:hypothetical protein